VAVAVVGLGKWVVMVRVGGGEVINKVVSLLMRYTYNWKWLWW